jgi:phosphopantetheinyl transferase (holo-ACP synthase)
MIGNDVVDLAQRGVQPGAQHPRFDARVFCERERALIAGDATLRVRWVLWAAKEATYKLAKKLDAAVVWAPARFEVSLESRAHGVVQHGARRFALRTLETDEYVHALATDAPQPAGEQSAGVARLRGEDASAAARAYACEELAARLGLAPAALSIAKRGRIPVLCVDGAPARADLSLSHHGRFVAYACEFDGAAQAARLAS